MKQDERGSLALEQVLFIAAIVVLGAAVAGFYNRLGAYFSTVPIQPSHNRRRARASVMKQKVPSHHRGRPAKLRPWWLNQLMTLAALVVIVIGFFAARSHPPAPRVEIVSEEDVVLIPVPQRQVARGEKLANVQFLTVRWPKSKLSGEYLLEIEEARDSFTLGALPPHLPMPRSALTKHQPEGNVVAESITPGMRAITVRVDAESAVEGWARSGNFIDVILVRTSKEGLESLVVAENVRILSAGASALPVGSGDSAPKAPNTVTLLVSQEDALRVKTAANVGKLTFALRGTGDTSPTLSTALDQRKLFGQGGGPVRPPELIGRAKGPDGKTYLLSRDSKWFRSTGEQESE